MAQFVSVSASVAGQRLASPAIKCRASHAPSTSIRPVPLSGERYTHQRTSNVSWVVHAGKEGGVIDRPATTPKIDHKSSTSKKRPPIYNVMLHNDNYNRREYVVKVLLKVIDCINVDDAINIMQEAHNSGVALVTSCAQDTAEQYCESLRLNGLISSLEPGC